MKRAQAEIIGLMLIVILVAIGFLLYLKFSLSPDGGGNVRAKYEQNQMGQTFLNSLVQWELDCNGQLYPVRKLIQGIAAGNGPTSCGSKTTEEFLEENIKKVLEKTLDQWGINYRLLIIRPSDDDQENGIGLSEFNNTAYPSDQRCSKTMNRVADRTLIQLYPNPGTVEVRLERC